MDIQSDKQDNIMTENLQTLDGPSPCEKNLIQPTPKIVINKQPA